jgi:hypothetical protein
LILPNGNPCNFQWANDKTTMKQVLVNRGEVIVDEVPAPIITENSILVRVSYSLISAGTETSGVVASGESLLCKAWRQPEKVKKVLDTVKTQGFSQTVDIVKA